MQHLTNIHSQAQTHRHHTSTACTSLTLSPLAEQVQVL